MALVCVDIPLEHIAFYISHHTTLILVVLSFWLDVGEKWRFCFSVWKKNMKCTNVGIVIEVRWMNKVLMLGNILFTYRTGMWWEREKERKRGKERNKDDEKKRNTTPHSTRRFCHKSEWEHFCKEVGLGSRSAMEQAWLKNVILMLKIQFFCGLFDLLLFVWVGGVCCFGVFLGNDNKTGEVHKFYKKGIDQKNDYLRRKYPPIREPAHSDTPRIVVSMPCGVRAKERLFEKVWQTRYGGSSPRYAIFVVKKLPHLVPAHIMASITSAIRDYLYCFIAARRIPASLTRQRIVTHCSQRLQKSRQKDFFRL